MKRPPNPPSQVPVDDKQKECRHFIGFYEGDLHAGEAGFLVTEALSSFATTKFNYCPKCRKKLR